MDHCQQQMPEKAYLAGWVQTRHGRIIADYDPEESLEELQELAASAGAQVVGSVLQRSPEADAATLVGRGKAREICADARAAHANVIIFDHDLTPTQLRNLESVLQSKVIDRTQLILDIFVRRARSRDGCSGNGEGPRREARDRAARQRRCPFAVDGARGAGHGTRPGGRRIQ